MCLCSNWELRMVRKYSSERALRTIAHTLNCQMRRLVLQREKAHSVLDVFSYLFSIPKKNRWLNQSRFSSYIACALERADGSFFAQAKRSHHAVSTMQILFVKKLFHPLLTTSNSETKALIRGLPSLFEHFLKVYSIVQVLKIMFLPIKHLLGLYGR